MNRSVLTVAQVLDRGLEQNADADAVIGRSGILTYRQLDAAADAAAGGLWDLGVRPGERVAATLPNDLDVVVAFHAVMRLGAIWVGLPEALAAAERDRLLRHCRPRLYLHGAQVTATGQLPAILIGSGSVLWQQMLTSGQRPPAVSIDPHAAAGIAYTSGTTGEPKGVVHSQHNLLLPGAVLTVSRHYGPELRKGDCLPLTILNLLALTTLLTAQAGGCCVVMDRRDASGIVEWLSAHEINVWNGVPTQLRDLIQRADISRADLAGLDEVWCGGAELPDKLRVDFAAKFGLDIRATYGLTEAPSIVAIDPPGRCWRAGASGQVLPHVRVSAIDGELCVDAAPDGRWRGAYTPMLGYWDTDAVHPAATPLRTGDLGTVDRNRWLHIVGRSKLVIVRGGANVYPTEVEHVIKGVGGVADAAVFGTPDERLGERVTALVEFDADTNRRPTAQQLITSCRASLAAYKVPDTWLFVDSLPRNAMGKVQRADLSTVSASAFRLESDIDD